MKFAAIKGPEPKSVTRSSSLALNAFVSSSFFSLLMRFSVSWLLMDGIVIKITTSIARRSAMSQVNIYIFGS